MQNSSFLIYRLWKVLSRKRQKQLIILLFIMIISAISELITIGAVIPFLTVLTNQDNLTQNYFMRFLLNFFNINQVKDLLLPFSLLLAFAAIISSLLRILNLFLNLRFGAILGSDLGAKAYQSILLQTYQQHLKLNSSKLIAGISTFTDNSANALNCLLLVISNSIISLTIIFGIIIFNYKIAICVTIFLGSLYYLVIRKLRKKISSNSKNIVLKNEIVIKLLQEGIGSLKDIILNGNAELYLKLFNEQNFPKKKLAADNLFFGIFPRYAIEGLSILIIAILSGIFASRDQEGLQIIIILGTLAISSQRLLPTLQGVYNNWVGFKMFSADIYTLLNIIKLEKEKINSYKVKPLRLKNKLEFRSVYFSYDKERTIISDMNLEIYKGERVGFIGKTGSGKTTTVDLIMGLLKPSKGSIYIDGINIFDPKNSERLYAWRKSIAHVPQNIFLSDSTIAENIAFGVPKKLISMSLVKEAAKKAQIDKFIESQKQGYSTYVGERGIILSGGEKQRICIARALYKKAKILIFDEATSSLDLETENATINAIEKLDKDISIIMIAHRESTLKKCNKIIKLDKGKIVAIGSPKNLLKY